MTITPKKVFHALPSWAQKPVRQLRDNFVTKPQVLQDTEEVPLEVVAKFLPQNPIVVEAGAHLGHHTVWMSQFWPSGTVHAFEPIPTLYQKLQQATVGLENALCYPFALSDRVGISDIFISSGVSDASSSLLQPTGHLSAHPTVYFEEKTQVFTTTLDEWAEQYKVPHIDFLWLDMQGHELAVLKAAPICMQSVKAIHTEVSYNSLYENTGLFPELCCFLDEQGFKIEVEKKLGEDAGNVLFVKNNV